MLEMFSTTASAAQRLPMLPFGISAGFPSPALDFEDIAIDLNQQLIDHPTATYYGRVQGESMCGAGIDDGDLLIIDKSIEPTDGKIAVCYLDGEFTLKRLKINKKEFLLMPENPKYQPIKLKTENNLAVWGIVTYVIKKSIENQYVCFSRL